MSIEIAMLRSISFLIFVLGHDFVSEESCRFSVSVCDEGLLLRKFQFESIAQEITQALFDFFDFFLRTCKSKQRVIGVSNIIQPPVVWIIRVNCWQLLRLLGQFACFFKFSFLPLFGGFFNKCEVRAVVSSLFFACVLWDKSCFYVLIQLVQVDIAQYW